MEENKITEIEDADARLKKLIAKMSMTNKYWGYLFSRINRMENSHLPSIMGVSYDGIGRIILNFNPVFFNDTPDESIEKILEHEGLHVLNKHLPRLIRLTDTVESVEEKNKKIGIFNIAADICVNRQADITVLDIMGKENKAQRAVLYNLPDDKITEFYHHELLKQEKNQKNDSQKQNGNGNKGEDNSEDKGNIDDHSQWQNGNGESKITNADASTIARKIENYTTKIVKDSVKNFNKKRGEFPNGVEELINEILAPPKLPYYMMIKKLVKGSKLSKFKRTPTRINRKRVYTFFLNDNKLIPQISPFPGRMRDYTFDIGILLDTSGSMSKEDILEGLCAVKNVFENDRHCTVTVIENDIIIQKEYKIKKIKDIEFNIRGRGGTILEPGLKRFSKIDPDIVLCFTDAECDNIMRIPRKDRPKKIIWVVPENAPLGAIEGTGYIVETN